MYEGVAGGVPKNLSVSLNKEEPFYGQACVITLRLGLHAVEFPTRTIALEITNCVGIPLHA